MEGVVSAPDASVDITREVCPMTYVRVKLKLETLEPGQQLEVWLQGEEPARNVPRSAIDEGHRVVEQVTTPEGRMRLLIEVGGQR